MYDFPDVPVPRDEFFLKKGHCEKIKQVKNMQIKFMQYECSVREKNFKTNLSTKKSVPFLQQKLMENKNDFNHSNLVTSPSLFPYLCGLNIDQFNILLHCIVPCLHSVPCSDCVGGTNYRKLDSTLIISYNNNVGLFS